MINNIDIFVYNHHNQNFLDLSTLFLNVITFNVLSVIINEMDSWYQQEAENGSSFLDDKIWDVWTKKEELIKEMNLDAMQEQSSSENKSMSHHFTSASILMIY